MDRLERFQRKRLGEGEEDFNKAAELIGTRLRQGKDRSEEKLLGEFKRFSGYDKEDNPFRKKVKGFFGTDFSYRKSQWML